MKSFLMVGMGAGTLFHVIRKAYPEAELAGIEKDPTMLQLAREEFNLPSDIQVILSRAEEALPVLERTFDFILVDVFDGMYPPKAFLEKQMLATIAGKLSPGGMVCMNTCRRNARDPKHRMLKINFGEVFDDVREIIPPEGRHAPFLPHNVILTGRKTNA